MSGVLRWEEPPPSQVSGGHRRGHGMSRWEGVATELRERPGEWALIADEPVTGGRGGRCTSLATQIRTGQIVCFSPAGDFDAEARREGDARKVWAVYVGDDEDGPP